MIDLSSIIGIIGIIVTVGLGFFLYFKGVRTRDQQKAEVGRGEKRGSTKEKNKIQKANTLIEYATKDNSFFLLGKTNSTIAFFVLNEDNVDLVIGGSRRSGQINKLYKLLKDGKIDLVYKEHDLPEDNTQP